MSKARSLSLFISDPSIEASEIGSNAITTDKIADFNVTHDKLHNNLDLTAKTVVFADDAISGNKINSGVISNFASTGIDDNASATAITIDSSGRVGIGTTSPSANLEIKPAGADGSLKITSDANSGHNVAITQGYNTYITASDNLYMGVGGTADDLSIVGGNVGIGTTNPNATYRLDVNGNSGIRIQGGTVGSLAIRSASGYANFISFNENNVADRGAIGFVSGSGDMQFRNNGAYDLATGSERMRITSAGDLLVGTTNNDVGGSVTGIRLRSNGAILNSIDGTGFYDTTIYADRRGTNNAGNILSLALGGYWKSSIGVLGTSHPANDGGITFNTIYGNDTLVEQMRVFANGVGFGKASDDVNSSLTLVSVNTGAANHEHTFAGPAVGTNDNLLFDLNKSGGAYGSFVVRFEGTNKLYIPGASLANNGNAYLLPSTNFGIGTTSPQYKLSVQGEIQAQGGSAEFIGNYFSTTSKNLTYSGSARTLFTVSGHAIFNVKAWSSHNNGGNYSEYAIVWSTTSKAMSTIHTNQAYGPGFLPMSLNTSTGAVTVPSNPYGVDWTIMITTIAQNGNGVGNVVWGS